MDINEDNKQGWRTMDNDEEVGHYKKIIHNMMDDSKDDNNNKGGGR